MTITRDSIREDRMNFYQQLRNVEDQLHNGTPQHRGLLHQHRELQGLISYCDTLLERQCDDEPD